MDSDNSESKNKKEESDISKQFKGLPIGELIGGPLSATADAQKKLAQSAFEFMTEVGFTNNGVPHMLEFDLQRPVEGATQPQKTKVVVPFLRLVPLPNLLIDDVQVDFQMETTVSEKLTENKDSDASTNANANFNFGCLGGGSVNVSGKETAKYQEHVSARQQCLTEGLSKLMDIMASRVEPIQSK